MEKDLIYKIRASEHPNYYQLFFEVKGIRSESFGVFTAEIIKQVFSMTDEEFETKLQHTI